MVSYRRKSKSGLIWPKSSEIETMGEHNLEDMSGCQSRGERFKLTSSKLNECGQNLWKQLLSCGHLYYLTGHWRKSTLTTPHLSL